MTARTRPRPRAPHWYRIRVGECPVCGRDRTYRVRVAGPRPRDRRARYVDPADSQTDCGCGR